jgi:hypothetical protein
VLQVQKEVPVEKVVEKVVEVSRGEATYTSSFNSEKDYT